MLSLRVGSVTQEPTGPQVQPLSRLDVELWQGSKQLGVIDRLRDLLPGQVVLGLTGLALVYYLAPARSRGWHLITPGSMFALVTWLVMSLVLRLYVSYFANYNATYGSIGGVILLMLWLYWSGVALLVGAEIDSVIERADAERSADPSVARLTLPREAPRPQSRPPRAGERS